MSKKQKWKEYLKKHSGQLPEQQQRGSEKVTERKPEEGRTQIREIAFSETYSGIVPRPSDLEHFERVYPGAAKIIFDMAQKQSEHRQAQESKIIEGNIRSSKRGQICALIIGIVGILGTVACAYLNQPAPASVLGGGTLVSLVGAFIYGTKSQREERAQKISPVSQQR